MRVVKPTSRDNARQPINWGEYILQGAREESVLNFYSRIIELWRSDPVIADGELKVNKITKGGVFDFERRLDRKIYKVHLDFTGKTKSTLIDDKGEIVIKV